MKLSGILKPSVLGSVTWKGFDKATAWEPCILAMKPTEGTFADNAKNHGLAGLNIDRCKIGNDVRYNPPAQNDKSPGFGMLNGLHSDATGTVTTGRWPANLILDESFTHQWTRYFYQAKASAAERTAGTTNGNNHPCVKSLDLNRYLATLILPPERDTPRRCLVPFSGSGSEVIGALLAGFEEVVGIEKEREYVQIAEERIKHWTECPLIPEEGDEQ